MNLIPKVSSLVHYDFDFAFLIKLINVIGHSQNSHPVIPAGRLDIRDYAVYLYIIPKISVY